MPGRIAVNSAKIEEARPVVFPPSDGEPDEASAEQRFQRLKGLMRVGRIVNSSLDLKRVLEVVLDVCLEATAADAGVVRLLEEPDRLRVVSQKGFGLTEKDATWVLRVGEGIAGRAALHREVTCIQDVRKCPDLLVAPEKMRGFTCLLCLPIIHQEQLVGVLTIISRHARNWKVSDHFFLESMGTQVGLAISNARLYEKSVKQACSLEQRVVELESLVEFARAVSSSLSLSSVMEIGLNLSLKALGADSAVIHLLDESGVLKVAFQKDLNLTPEDRAWTIPLGEGVAGLAARDRRVLAIEDLRTSPEVILSPDKIGSYTSILVVPMTQQGRLVGTMSIFSRQKRPWQADEKYFLESLGNQIGLALANAELYERSLEQSRNLEQRTLELELLNSQMVEGRRILDALFEGRESGWVLVNEAAVILKASPVVGEWFDLEPDFLVAKSVEKFIDALLARVKSGRLQIEEVRQILSDGAAESEFEISSLTVGNRAFSLRHLPLRRDGGKIFGKILVLTDRTAQEESARKLKEAQALVLQSEKLASIGQLAAGVAHELNNPIAFVKSNLGTLGEYVGEVAGVLQRCQEAMVCWEKGEKENSSRLLGEALKAARRADLDGLIPDLNRIVEESLEGADRVAKIVQDLKNFSHVDEAEWKLADINRGLESTLNLVWNELKYKAAVLKELGDIPPIHCYPMQLNQVFMNLLVNASQAIPEKGEIRVKTYARDGEIVVEVSDTGVGIAPEYRGRIFEPFFTTKPVGKGTGLGLSITYGIVQKHGGIIEVESEPGKGSLFRIRLPMGGESGAVHDTLR